jgi:sugar phosphate isomerase/epimerase
MQLGFVTAILGDLPLEEVLAFAAGEGYRCVEAIARPSAKVDRPYGGVCHIDVTNFTQGQADDIRALCEKHRVQLSALGYYANALSNDATEAEVARTPTDTSPALSNAASTWNSWRLPELGM